MAGHSKWKNIQHRKGAQDRKRSKIFTKVGLELQVATRMGGEDPAANPRLRLAITKARGVNMPKDIIQRNIKRGLNLTPGENYIEKTYEGYGPGGVAVYISCLTDNVNRTVAEVRHVFSKKGGNLGTEGSVAWMFKRYGLLVFDLAKVSDPDELMSLAVDQGAEDLNENDGALEIKVSEANFNTCREALEAHHAPDYAAVGWYPHIMSDPSGEDQGKLKDLLESLEDLDDVQEVFHNAQLSEDN